MKRYESYKESGVPWIATIPVDWKKQKNTHLFVERQELSVSGEETLLSLSQYTGITLKSNAAKAGMREAESKVGYRIVYKDDIVMNIMLAWNGSTAVSPLDGIISPASGWHGQRAHHESIDRRKHPCARGRIVERQRNHDDAQK